MEVTVLEAANPPPKPVIAIHAGSVRRQVRMEVNHSFQIPHPGSVANGVQVTLFQQLTSQSMPVDDGKKEATCNIPVRIPNGTSSEVKLRIRREAPKATKAGEDTLGETRDYLDHHKLQQRIQTLIQDVLRAQPADPYRYMLDCLKGCKADPESALTAEPATAEAAPAPPAQPKPPREEKAAAQPEAKAAAPPLVPKPPERPPPSSASPRKARNYSASSSSAKKSGQEEEAKAKEEPKAKEADAAPSADRSEARKAARASISMILGMPKCEEEAKASFKANVHEQLSQGRAASILERARLKTLDQVARCHDVRLQAKLTVRNLLATAAARNSSEYRSALAKWSVKALLRCAANKIGGDEERRKDCFAPHASSRRCSAPTPIVYLGGEGGSSWGSWLSGTTGK